MTMLILCVILLGALAFLLFLIPQPRGETHCTPTRAQFLQAPGVPRELSSPMINITNNIRGNNNVVVMNIRVVTVNLRARRVTFPIWHNGQWITDEVDCVGRDDRQVKAAIEDRRQALVQAGWHVDKPTIDRPRSVQRQLTLGQGQSVPQLPARGFVTAPGEM